ncbi:MAG TPA: O-antigen ligase family protein [Solirubrobacterales bacterium]|nr:O-antigen ligase family protein [Solirubrobacterales bacterium]
MDTTATLASPRSELQQRFSWIDPQAIAVWLLGFGLVVFLGLNGGGYDPIVRNQLGIAVWWGVLLGLAVGALPLNRFRAGSWVALALLGGYVAWVALSLIWTDATHNSLEEVGKVVTYLGIFALALSIRGEKGARRMVSALGAGIAVIALVALVSRLHPAWVPAAKETVELFHHDQFRLAYPLGYWNANASLVAIGLPLVLYVACAARHTVTRALAAAALPALALTIYFTFSRGGTLAAIFGTIVFLALAHDRLPKAMTVLIAGVGSAILIVASHQRHALAEGFANPAAHHQGNEILAMTLVVCAGVGLIQAGLTFALRYGQRPAWTRPSRRTSLIAVGGGIAVVIIAALALGAPGKASHAWHEFKAAKGTTHGSARLESFSSNGRWPLWEAALEENSSAPLTGRGAGSFEGWWAQHRHGELGFVEDAHSLYLEALAELGLVGFALLAAFLAWVFVAGGRRYRRASSRRKTQLAATLAGCAAFCLGSAYDWLWQIAVLPIAFLLLASVLVSAGERRRSKPFPVFARLGGVAFSVAAMIALAIPLSSALALQGSQSEFRAGNLAGALTHATSARRAAPFTAQPWTQEALVLEAQGKSQGALAAAQEATRAEPEEWRAWVVRSRLEATTGHAAAAVAAYRRARSLNPASHLFDR